MTEAYENDLLREPQPAPKAEGRGFFTPGNIALLAAILVAGVIVAAQLFNQRQSQPTTGQAPEFAFTTFDGQEARLSDYRGQVVVLNFWASWCIPCEEEAPELQSAWERYEPTGEVVFLGVAYADNGPGSLSFLEEYGITYMNAPDIGTRISDQYNIQGVPETFIIDKEGNISAFFYAGVTEAQVTQVVDGLIS